MFNPLAWVGVLWAVTEANYRQLKAANDWSRFNPFLYAGPMVADVLTGDEAARLRDVVKSALPTQAYGLGLATPATGVETDSSASRVRGSRVISRAEAYQLLYGR